MRPLLKIKSIRKEAANQQMIWLFFFDEKISKHLFTLKLCWFILIHRNSIYICNLHSIKNLKIKVFRL